MKGKTFEWPQVIVQEMAMAESIASACCYSKLTDGMVTTLTPLNGGDIVANYQPDGYQIKSSVVQHLGGIAMLPPNHYTLYVPSNYCEDVQYDEGASPVGEGIRYNKYDVISFGQCPTDGTPFLFGEATNVYTIKDNTLKRWSDYSIVGAYLKLTYSECDHLTRDCPFNEPFPAIARAHVGATVPHALGTSYWMNPHAAQEFNS